MSVLDDIAAERKRQIVKEGWDHWHDDGHVPGTLAKAAACYAAGGSIFRKTYNHNAEIYLPVWPWSSDWWKPKDARRDLIRAAALIVAEIERMDRNSSHHIQHSSEGKP